MHVPCRQDKIRLLLEHCLRHDKALLLVERLRAANPAQYEAHRDRLRG